MELRNLKELAGNLRNSFASSFDPSDRKLPQSFKDRVTKINTFNLAYNDYSVVFGGGNGSLDSYIPNQLFYIAAHYNEYTQQLFYYKSEIMKVISASGFSGNLTELFTNERKVTNIEGSLFYALLKDQDIKEEDKELLYKFVTDYDWWHGAKTIERADFFNSAILNVMGMTASSNSTLAMICGFFANNPDVADLLNDESEHKTKKSALQTIFFGSPGTGKSFKIQNSVLKGVSDEFVFRTTFHPDTDYASFVGCYKPTMIDNNNLSKCLTYEELVTEFKKYLDAEYLDRKTQRSWKNITTACCKFGYDFYDSIIHMEDEGEHTIPNLVSDAYKSDSTYDTSVRAGMQIYSDSSRSGCKSENKIIYKFIPQTFSEAYVKAWKNTAEDVFLVIEEINRGNCAQIFGDLFQLLDRNDDGVSEYPIKADADLAGYLIDELGYNHEGIADGKIKLPGNLYILATMNTSDQSLFPMDSAFKRRWEWKFVPTRVKYKDEEKVLRAQNIKEITLYSDDKADFAMSDGMWEYKWSEFLSAINARIETATKSDDKKLGFWFVKTMTNSNTISIDTFVSKVLFYLWNDVFKDFGPKKTNPFAIKGADGERHVQAFSTFFSEETGELDLARIHSFMYNLGLNPEPVKEVQDAIDEHLMTEEQPVQ